MPSPTLAHLLDSSADAVQAVLEGHSLSGWLPRVAADLRPGTQALSFHALRWLGAAQVVRGLLAPKAPPPRVDALLTTALALLWPASQPPYAAHTLVNQAVAAARQRTPAAAAFVNAVLRRFLRDCDALVHQACAQPIAQYNHPPWWLKLTQQEWPNNWPAMLAAAQVHPAMALRVNARRSSAAAYVQRLAAQDRRAHVHGDSGVVLQCPCPVHELPGFAEGEVSVQDLNAQQAAPLLLGAPGLARGARVLDACAAPGGKTAHLLELAELDLLALDSDAGRLARVSETLTRLHLTAEVRVGDAARPEGWWDGRPFDAILLDAPCTASGIVRRHPDIRWLRRADDVPALARQQTRLLDALWPLLKPGGRLLFATCSTFRLEGAAQTDAFLQRQASTRPRLDAASPGHLLPVPDNPSHAAGTAGADGFFYALIHKP